MTVAPKIVTFLFTDIERSSQLWEQHPQAMGRALAQHDELMRETLAAHGGQVFKTVGDAFCVAFSHAAAAVRAAGAAQLALAKSVWEETGPLRVRMALHTGEAEQRDGDYFGRTLNRVARILATGHGGQTLLSEATAVRARDDLSPDFTLRELGERRLKDLARPERIFQLVVRDLPADFPPLRSLEVLPNNLPAQVTSFVGRNREMADVKRALESTRLLTLTGPGGTGKTRLSLQVAAEVLEQYPHGVWLVELATFSEEDEVTEAVAAALEIRAEAEMSLLDQLFAALRSRRLLLVLDNCEHLIGACAKLVAAMLRRCPEVRVLASSREPLNIAGETLWPVPPLATPELDPRLSYAESTDPALLESVQLFVERAAAVKPGFALTPENADLIARICWRLDGLPLAIELAAARVKLLPLPQILARLDDRFKLLSGGSRTALPRQQTLGALIDWSYDLLSEPERALLRRLSVFVAGRTLEQAEAVCADEILPEGSVFEILSALVDKSLVMSEPGPDGDLRYTFLESVWDYADERLIEKGEKQRFRQRHLEYFTRFAEEMEPVLMGPDQKAALERLNVELFNLNHALHFSQEQPETIELGLRLAGAINRFCEVRSYLTEGYEHFTELLAKVDGNVSPAVLANAHLGAGRLAWCQDRDDDATGHLLQALELYRQQGDVRHEAETEFLLGLVERNEARLDQAEMRFLAAKALSERHQMERQLALAQTGLGSLAVDRGEFETGRTMKEESLATFRGYGDVWIVGLMCGSLGRACFAAGDLASARRYWREGLQTSRELGNKWSLPYAFEALADLFAEEGAFTRAVRLYGAASMLREALALAFAPSETTLHERGLSRLRQQLPPADFEEAWQAGRGLPLHTAVGLALGSA